MDRDFCLKEVDKDIGWYDKKAIKAKRGYMINKTITIIATSIITLTASAGSTLEPLYSRYIFICTAILASLITILEMYSQIRQNANLYILYRETWESLEQEKRFFLVGVSPYNQENEQQNIKLLIERCQKCKSKTMDEWSKNIKSGMKES